MEEQKLLSTYNDKGEEIPDPNPVSMHVKFRRQVPLADRVKQLIHSENLKRWAEANDLETFDEADDFDIPEEDMSSPWEDNFEPDLPGIAAKQAEIRAGIVKDVPDDRLVKARELLQKVEEAKKQLAWLAAKKRQLEAGSGKPAEPVKEKPQGT